MTFTGIHQEYAQHDLFSVLMLPTTALIGVDEKQAKLLNKLHIRSIYDLAFSDVFNIALEIAGSASSQLFNIMGTTPTDRLDDGVLAATDNLAGESVVSLRRISAAVAKEIELLMDVRTIGDMANWSPYVTARELGQSVSISSEQGQDNGQVTAPELLPRLGGYSTQIAHYNKAILIDTKKSSKTSPLKEPLDINAISSSNAGISVGAMLRYRQEWKPIGLTLGEMVNSVTLMPGETTKIAVIDWVRRMRTSATEGISENESLSNTLIQQSSVDRVTDFVALEAQSGTSATSAFSQAVAFGVGAGVGGTAPGVAAGAGAAFGYANNNTNAMSLSSSQGRRDVSASFGEDIAVSTRQAARSERSRKASLVTEATTEEREEISTRSMTNYNHMHALNMLYFDVVQIYRISLVVERVERLLLVPVKQIIFDRKTLIRHRSTLVSSALTLAIRDLMGTFENRVGMTIVLPRFIPSEVDDTASSGRSRRTHSAEIKSKARLKAVFGKANLNIENAAIAISSDLSSWQTSGDLSVQSVNVSNDNGVVTEVVLRLNDRNDNITLPRNDLAVPQPFSVVSLHSIKVSVNPGEEDRQIRLSLIVSALGNGNSQNRTAALPLDVVIPAKQKSVIILRCESLNDGDAELIDHLNDNADHYSAAIWTQLGPDAAHQLLADKTYDGKSIIDHLDPEPRGMSGGRLVFNWHDDRDKDWVEWLSKSGLNKSYQRSELIALPTGGVFGEAVLGRSNSAEKLDMTRFWNWQDSPAPVSAPDIAAIQAGQHNTSETPQPGQLGPQVLNIMNPPSGPSVDGLGGVLNAGMNGNLFRDMSGLAHTSALARTAMELSSASANNALNRAAGLATSFGQLGLASSLDKKGIDLNKGGAPTNGGAGRSAGAGGGVSSGANVSPGGSSLPGGTLIAGASPMENATAQRLATATQNPSVLGATHNELGRTSGPAAQSAFLQNVANPSSGGGDAVFASGGTDDPGFWTHLVRWHDVAEGGDTRNLKQVRVHRSEFHDVEFGALSMAMPGMSEASPYEVKCQVHRAVVKTDKTLDQMWAHAQPFEDLVRFDIGLANLKTRKIVGQAGQLALGDRFQFDISPAWVLNPDLALPLFTMLNPILLGSAGFPLSGVSGTAFFVNQIFGASRRKFGVEVIETLLPSNGECGWAVQTLEGHPYAGRRSWRIRQLTDASDGKHQYQLETMEFNGWNFMFDHIVEKLALGIAGIDGASETWMHWICNLKTASGAEFVNNRNGSGGSCPEVEFINPPFQIWPVLRKDAALVEILNGHAKLAEEKSVLESSDRLLPPNFL